MRNACAVWTHHLNLHTVVDVSQRSLNVHSACAKMWATLLKAAPLTSTDPVCDDASTAWSKRACDTDATAQAILQPLQSGRKGSELASPYAAFAALMRATGLSRITRTSVAGMGTRLAWEWHDDVQVPDGSTRHYALRCDGRTAACVSLHPCERRAVRSSNQEAFEWVATIRVPFTCAAQGVLKAPKELLQAVCSSTAHETQCLNEFTISVQPESEDENSAWLQCASQVLQRACWPWLKQMDANTQSGESESDSSDEDFGLWQRAGLRRQG